jgi:hypothetical protein
MHTLKTYLHWWQPADRSSSNSCWAQETARPLTCSADHQPKFSATIDIVLIKKKVIFSLLF